MKNLGTTDRLARAILAELSFLAAFFWMGRAWQMVLYLLAGVMVFQAASGVCGIYGLIGRNTCERVKRKDKNLVVGMAILMVLVAGVGSYASTTITKNILVDDLKSIERPYDLTLSSTGQDLKMESIEDYELMNTSLADFVKKYSDYRPLALKFDEKFQGDMQNISTIVRASKQDIYAGRLSEAHNSLIAVGPILKSIKNRDFLE